MTEKHYFTGNVRELAYEDGILNVTFSGGEIYRYFDVPSEVALPIFKVESAGKYLNEFIKGKFETKKVS